MQIVEFIEGKAPANDLSNSPNIESEFEADEADIEESEPESLTLEAAEEEDQATPEATVELEHEEFELEESVSEESEAETIELQASEEEFDRLMSLILRHFRPSSPRFRTRQ